MSDTISSGGFSRASAYCRNWLNAASRFARRPLYSQAKQPRFQTSAQPSPPVSFLAPRSKQYDSPVESASVGVGSPSSRQRSLKCDCDAERSFNSDARHLAMNAPGVIVPVQPARRVRGPSPLVPLNGPRAVVPISCYFAVASNVQSRSAGCRRRPRDGRSSAMSLRAASGSESRSASPAETLDEHPACRRRPVCRTPRGASSRAGERRAGRSAAHARSGIRLYPEMQSAHACMTGRRFSSRSSRA